MTVPVRIRKPSPCDFASASRCVGERGQQGRPGLRFTVVQHAAAAVGIVEAQDLRLADGAGAAQAGGMQRIALDLDRPAVDVPHQDAGRIAVQHTGRGNNPLPADTALRGGNTGGISTPLGAPSSQPLSPASARPAAISFSTLRRSRGAAKASAKAGKLGRRAGDEGGVTRQPIQAAPLAA